MDQADVQRLMLDPELPQKRKLAQRLFAAAVAPVATAHGHAKGAAGEWVRQSALCWSRVWIQKSRSGFACYLNIDYASLLAGLKGPLRSARIGAFAATVADHNRLDALHYVELGETSPLRDEIITLLQTRAMPWLDRCHTLTGARERNHVPFGLMPQ
jgi:hypothetical protein